MLLNESMKPTVLIQQQQLPNYRIPLFNILSRRVNLTVLHSSDPPLETTEFKQIIRPLHKFGPFLHQHYYDLLSNYDVLITEANLRFLLCNIFHAFFPRRYKWIPWGIGVSASYSRHFGQKRPFEFLRFFLYRQSDALIFYSNKVLPTYISHGFRGESLFVANNTVFVPTVDSFPLQNKNTFLFVGSLHPSKRILDLITSFFQYVKHVESPLKFHIVGTGPDYDKAVLHTQHLGIESLVVFHGSIYDEERLASLFRNALFCISPFQAGLSVLKSFGYGAPFIAHSNSITGGELYNIKNDYNGYLLNSLDIVYKYFLDADQNPSKYVQMGINARSTYLNDANPESFVATFVDAIDYVMAN